VVCSLTGSSSRDAQGLQWVSIQWSGPHEGPLTLLKWKPDRVLLATNRPSALQGVKLERGLYYGEKICRFPYEP
jgi:hypothetical protein